jgi:hypothetical protein
MRKLFVFVAIGALAVGASAQEGIVVDYDISGAQSWDAYAAATNEVHVLDAAALIGLPSGTPVTMNGIGWDVTIETVGGSYLSEARMYFDDNIAPDGTGLFLTPGVNDGSPPASMTASPAWQPTPAAGSSTSVTTASPTSRCRTGCCGSSSTRDSMTSRARWMRTTSLRQHCNWTSFRSRPAWCCSALARWP